ncbi:hypothetical protein EYR40_001156 [Pleurotus pulmonarius]|nr:hypothetical protein EYR38_004397 [Pleurotus pulmonarius]KAF4608809.1 hypothetical protein EYR40_001156 [Pleurotus pulmonarius]
MCLYLLACGASRTQFDILNHAGLSLSYPSAIKKIKELGQSKLRQIVDIAHNQPFMIIWDNLNITFRVGEQRKASKDHFDNGTTATLIPLFNVEPGSLGIELKPPRTTRRPVIDIMAGDLLPSYTQIKELEMDIVWHIEDILFTAFPLLRSRLADSVPPPSNVESIPLHKTEQYPLPTMHIDESSLDGTLQVLEKIIVQTLKMDADAIKKHGIIICAGDQLSVSLLDKAPASRRDDTSLMDNLGRYTQGQLGLFHIKMAGDRMVVNEFWGVPNSESPWSLWKLNTLLGRKAISAGWKSKSPTPFRQTYDLILSLALPAHILDAFRILCNGPSLEQWVEGIETYDEIHEVAIKVHQQFCSARRVSELRKLNRRDVPLENIILFIRDALILRSLKFSIKRGDIGTVINILAHWMNPVLRNAFVKNWLANLSGRMNGFKEMDLLQEHQNFWAKIIYNARGSNRSWTWLAMVSVSIFALREVMRQVQDSFEIPYNSLAHSTPDTAADILDIRQYLESQTLQTYTPDRPFNDVATPARDLLSAGAVYANTASAFKNFRWDTRSANNLGFTSEEAAPAHNEDNEPMEELFEEHDLDLDDLTLDSEEFPLNIDPNDLVAAIEHTISELSMYE